MVRSTAFALILSVCLCAQDSPSVPKDRAKAVREIAKGGSSAAAKIAPYLKDEALEVRLEAVKALVSIGTQYSLDPLIEATKDNDAEVQIRAADGLVNFYLPGYVKSGMSGTLKRVGNSVTGVFTDNNDETVPPAMLVRPEVVNSLTGLIGGGSSMSSRANAARAAGILRGAGAVPALTEALRSKDDRLMYESLVALRKIGDKAAGPKAMFLLRDLDEKVQIAAIEMAGVLDVKEAAPDLRRVLETSSNRKVKRAALSSLAMLPAPENRELLLPYLSDKDEGMRSAAAEGLGRIGDQRDVEALENQLDADRKIGAKLSAAFGLVVLGKTELKELSPLEYVLNLLSSKGYRGVALPFLTELARQEGVRRALYGAMQHPMSATEKIAVAEALGESRARDAVEPLETMTKDSDIEVSKAAAGALTRLKASL